MGGAFGNVPQLTMCASIDSERLYSKTVPAEFYRSACFALIMPSPRRALRELSLTIEALRRKLRQSAASAVMISLTGSARGKIHGIARALHNSEKRARYNLAHRAVSGFSAISELAHSLHQIEHGLFRVPSRIRARLKTSVKRRTFGRSVKEG